MVTFTAEGIEDVAAGRVTVTWRLWKYAHVRAGHTYGLGSGSIEVDEVATVRAGDVSEADALEAGLPDVESLIELVRSDTNGVVEPDTLLYRVRFRYNPEPPPKPKYTLEEIAQRLERLDRASPYGPWTEQTLRLIEEMPGTVARRLAVETVMPVPAFKINVRKLKALGLTVSLLVGMSCRSWGRRIWTIEAKETNRRQAMNR